MMKYIMPTHVSWFMYQYPNVFFNYYHRIKDSDTYKAFSCLLQPSSVLCHLRMVLEMTENANRIPQIQGVVRTLIHRAGSTVSDL